MRKKFFLLISLFLFSFAPVKSSAEQHLPVNFTQRIKCYFPSTRSEVFPFAIGLFIPFIICYVLGQERSVTILSNIINFLKNLRLTLGRYLFHNDLSGHINRLDTRIRALENSIFGASREESLRTHPLPILEPDNRQLITGTGEKQEKRYKLDEFQEIRFLHLSYGHVTLDPDASKNYVTLHGCYDILDNINILHQCQHLWI